MTNRCTAFGLDIRSAFALPGMAYSEMTHGEAIPELPSLELAPAGVTELMQTWSGCEGPPEWRGRLGDGLDLTIERGASGDRLFAYGERAGFLLDASMGLLLCAPSRPGLDWQRVLISKVIPAIAVMRGYEGLHAAVVDSPDGAVAIMAPSGAGKSTLAIELLRRGLPLFADDVLVLERVDDTVRAHPGSPHMNLATDLPDAIDPQTLGETLGHLENERWLAAHTYTTLPRPVRVLCLLERAPGLPLGLETLDPAPLALAPHMLGISTDPERHRARFELYADLLESATLVRLTAGLEHAPAQLGDLLEEALVEQSRSTLTAGPVAGGVA